MARLVTNPNPAARLRGTDAVRTGRGTGTRGGTGLRMDARKALEKAAAGIRLRGTTVKAR